MARLVVNPGSTAAWEIRLQPGLNLIGRGSGNDFNIADPSVSSSHCQILVSEAGVMLKDLGSTNGTFVNHALAQEATLQSGHSIRLGSVEMVFYDDVPGPARAVPPHAAPLLPIGQLFSTETERIPRAASVPEPPPPVLAAPRPTATVTLPAAARPAPPPLPPSPRAPVAAGPHYCKFHPKTVARFFCGKCSQYFCELCVTSLAVAGVQRKNCRQCGGECAPLQVQIQRPVQLGFFGRLRGAFGYPFRGAGVFLMLVGVILFTGLKWGRGLMLVGGIRPFIFGIILQVFAGGYLFTFLQAIIHATAAEDREMPDLPGMSNFVEDILLPFLRLLGLGLICFGATLPLAIWVDARAAYAALILGGLYFPMAFLAVAILDSIGAANPLVVIPSILKVPLEYFVTILLLGVVFGLRPLGDMLLRFAFPLGFSTHSMAELFAFLGANAFWGVMSFYLLIVAVHILGLLYVSKKDKLGWLDR
jgi:hypothetical protein